MSETHECERCGIRDDSVVLCLGIWCCFDVYACVDRMNKDIDTSDWAVPPPGEA